MSDRVRHASLHHRSLFQFGEPAFYVFGALVAWGGLQMFLVLAALSDISRSGWALSWLLLALYATPVFVLVYRLDLYEREPLSLVFGAFAWGALAATSLSLQAVGWDQVVVSLFGPEVAARWGAAITAPLVEETLKGAGIVLLYLIARDEFDDTMDGFVYGAICGLGFALVEDVLYFMAVFGGTPAGVLQGFYLRVISSGLYGHVLFTGLTGMGIGYFVSRRVARPLATRLKVAIGLFALGVVGHFIWNSPLLEFMPAQPTGVGWLLVPVAFAVKGMPVLLLVLLALRLAHGQERSWLDASLSGELPHEGISAEELAVLREPKARRRAVRAMRTRAGRPAGRLLGRLHREQITLAMLASRVATPDDPSLVAQRDYCRSLRDALAAIPGAAPPAFSGGRGSGG
ncbi:MAG TPA: PrsW family intramembrane metalloprotease [Actinomycetota bacterium]